LKFIALSNIERNLKRPMGFEQSEWEIIYFPDADMYLEPTLIEEAVRRLQEDPTLEGFFIPEENIVEKWFWTKVKAFERSFYAADEPGVAAARIFRRETYKKVGWFNPALIAAEDWDLSDRIKESGAKLSCTQAKVLHDEWEVVLSKLLKKKAYYGEKLVDYGREKNYISLFTRIYFFRPAFYRWWREYLKHPILFLGLVFMLTAEMGVALWGMIVSLIRSKF
jgi:GT2 family glycosyltransferase